MAKERVVMLSGPQAGRTFEIDGTLTIGRNPDSGIRLDDAQVSRRHAVIEQIPDGTYVRDLGSGNGTFVGESRIVEARLSDGDVVGVGVSRMRFEGAAAREGVRLCEADLTGRVEAADAANVYETFFKAPEYAVTIEQQRDVQKRLTALYQANQIIASERELGKLFERVMDQIFSLVPAHNGVILLRDDKRDRLATGYVKSGSGDAVISSSIVRRAYEQGEAVLTYDAAGDSRFGGGASIISQNIASAMCTPLVHQDQTLGVLYVDTRGTTNAFTRNDLELLVALSGPAAIAIRNAQYLDELEQAYHDYLIVTSNAVEARDHYTVGHTWRVTNFALEVARELGWSEAKLKECEEGGVLHDVGKIAVDDAILRKTASLTDDEYARMKVHPTKGAAMLSDIERLKPLVPYCLYHHERYDGNGYPYGLKGEDVPIEGRLVAVADAFDAMTSNRPYRRGLPPDEAIAEIEKGSGTQFDPAIAAAMVRCYQAGRISRVVQESLKEEKSIACPFCSTYVNIPEGAQTDETFECRVCHRHIKLLQRNEAYYGELVAETDTGH